MTNSGSPFSSRPMEISPSFQVLGLGTGNVIVPVFKRRMALRLSDFVAGLLESPKEKMSAGAGNVVFNALFALVRKVRILGWVGVRAS